MRRVAFALARSKRRSMSSLHRDDCREAGTTPITIKVVGLDTAKRHAARLAQSLGEQLDLSCGCLEGRYPGTLDNPTFRAQARASQLEFIESLVEGGADEKTIATLRAKVVPE